MRTGVSPGALTTGSCTFHPSFELPDKAPLVTCLSGPTKRNKWQGHPDGTRPRFFSSYLKYQSKFCVERCNPFNNPWVIQNILPFIHGHMILKES